MLRRRPAFTLVELLVALVLTGVIMGAATLSAYRQQRTHLRIGALGESDRQLAASTAVILEPLAFLEGDAGDLVAGEARDTSLQARIPVMASLSCTMGRGSVVLLPDSGAHRVSGGVSAPRAGDSLWWYGDSTWSAAEVTATSTADVTCQAPSPRSGKATSLSLSRADSIPAGAPLRITRQTRYSLYKSGDGSWQLGIREWSNGSFAAPQPVAGPLLATGARRSGFRYFDAAGRELAVPADSRQVSRIRFVAHSLLSTRERGQDSVRSDSVDIAIARNPN